MRRIFLSMAVAAAFTGQATAASASGEVTTQDVRNLVGEACLGAIAIGDPGGYRRGMYNGQNDEICGCAVDAAMKAGFSEEQISRDRYSKKLRLISGSHQAVKVVADRCAKKLLGDEAPKIIHTPPPKKNW